MRAKLSDKLIRFHRTLTKHSARGRIQCELRAITQHIFEYIGARPLLIHRDISSNAARKVIKDEYVPALNISGATVKTTAYVWMYALKHRNTPKYAMEPLKVMNTMMHGQTSVRNMDYVNFYNVVQLAYDLCIPIEYLIYGTTSHSQISQYNYHYYDSLTRIGWNYLRSQMLFNGTIRHMLLHLEATYTLADISRQLRVSRQSLYNFINGHVAIFGHRQKYTQLCYIMHADPINMMKYRLMTRQQLQVLNHRYCESRKH